MEKNVNTTTTTNDVNNTFSGMTFSERLEMFNRKNALKAHENVTFKPSTATKTPLAPFATPVDMNARYDAIYAFTFMDAEEQTSFNTLVMEVEYDAYKYHTYDKVLDLATAVAVIILRTIHKKTGDNTILKMYQSTVAEGVHGIANDHIQTAAIELIDILKNSNSITALSDKVGYCKPLRTVFVDDNLKHTIKTKTVLINAIQSVFYKVRENIKSYDSFKYLDTRMTCIELDSENVENSNDLSYSTRFYQLISYNADKSANKANTSFEDFEKLLDKLELNDLQKRIIKFLNNNVGAGYKAVAYALFGKEKDYDTTNDRNKYVERVKKSISRLKKDINRLLVENVSDYAENLLNENENENGYMPTDNDLFNNAIKTASTGHVQTYHYLDRVHGKQFKNVDITVKTSALYHHTGDYRVTLDKNTYNTTNGLFEHTGDLNNVSIATWYFIENHKNSIVIVNR